jgi:hypothetical protein
VALYARGMTVREVPGFLAEIYATEVSPEFISKVTNEAMAEVIARPMGPICTPQCRRTHLTRFAHYRQSHRESEDTVLAQYIGSCI